MIYVAHRKNSIDELINTPTDQGVEVDIRSAGKELYINHDPFTSGPLFKEWIKHYKHQLLILNVKEEGLEEALITIMNENHISNFFFLDQSFPFIMKWVNKGEIRCAVRISEYENIATAYALSGKAGWAWIDVFNHLPINSDDAQKLKNSGFKLCLVSPELHGRNSDTVIPKLRSQIKAQNISFDAICTKRVDLWR